MGVTKEEVESALTSKLNPSHLIISILSQCRLSRLGNHPGKCSFWDEECHILIGVFTASSVKVIDTSGGCGASFELEIVSEQFEGKRLLERHRLVNAALTEEMKSIHALSIKKSLSPEQWKQQQESVKSPSAV